MIYIDNEGITDPRVNLALEEYVLRNIRSRDSFLLFYINAPSIIIGKHQNTLEEINHEFVKEKGIIVVRRISGGGAVYHDPGNLNFSIITQFDPRKYNKYDEFTRPVIEVLRELGVPAELGGRNDIVAGGKKISGNAQFTSKDRMFSHGTVLFDSDLDNLQAALNVKMSKIESKGVKSVRSRVTNISEFLNEKIDIQEFKNRILAKIFGSHMNPPTYQFREADWQAIHQLAAEKYSTWDWNYGESPVFNVRKSKRFPGGEIDLRIHVEQGHIRNVKIFGDFMSRGEISDLEKKLQDIRYEPEDIAHSLKDVNVGDYFGEITRNEFLDLVYG